MMRHGCQSLRATLAITSKRKLPLHPSRGVNIPGSNDYLQFPQRWGMASVPSVMFAQTWDEGDARR